MLLVVGLEALLLNFWQRFSYFIMYFAI